MQVRQSILVGTCSILAMLCAGCISTDHEQNLPLNAREAVYASLEHAAQVGEWPLLHVTPCNYFSFGMTNVGDVAIEVVTDDELRKRYEFLDPIPLTLRVVVEESHDGLLYVRLYYGAIAMRRAGEPEEIPGSFEYVYKRLDAGLRCISRSANIQ